LLHYIRNDKGGSFLGGVFDEAIASGVISVHSLVKYHFSTSFSNIMRTQRNPLMRSLKAPTVGCGLFFQVVDCGYPVAGLW
jgi:hypothetical protein